MSLLAQERDTYAELWGAVGTYADHSPGVEVLPIFLSLVGDLRGTVLDVGTGSGKGALALLGAGFRVAMMDVTEAGLVAETASLPFTAGCVWGEMPIGDFDWAYCTDVLEHVPPQFTMLAVHRMLQTASRGVFLSVSTVPDNFGIWMGKALHQTVQSFVWWRDSLREVGQVKDARDLLHSATFLVTR